MKRQHSDRSKTRKCTYNANAKMGYHDRVCTNRIDTHVILNNVKRKLWNVTETKTLSQPVVRELLVTCSEQKHLDALRQNYRRICGIKQTRKDKNERQNELTTAVSTSIGLDLIFGKDFVKMGRTGTTTAADDKDLP